MRHMESGDPYKLGQKAARDGKEATDCPYGLGKNRRVWLAGFFSVKALPPLADDDLEREEEE